MVSIPPVTRETGVRFPDGETIHFDKYSPIWNFLCQVPLLSCFHGRKNFTSLLWSYEILGMLLLTYSRSFFKNKYMLRYQGSLCSGGSSQPAKIQSPTYHLAKIFPKAAWKWKELELDLGGRASLAPPLHPPSNSNQKQQKSFVRSGIRTHARIRGPEHPLAFAGKDFLESGALDHSAILTTGKTVNFPFLKIIIKIIIIWRREQLHKVQFFSTGSLCSGSGVRSRGPNFVSEILPI